MSYGAFEKKEHNDLRQIKERKLTSGSDAGVNEAPLM